MTHVAQEPSRAGLRWLPLNVGTALVLATVFGLLTFLLTSTGESVTQPAIDSDAGAVQLEAASEPAVPAVEESVPAGNGGASQGESAATDSVRTTTFAEAGDSAALSTPLVARAGAITNMGPTEVGYVTNFPTVEYSWERVELPGPGSSDLGYLGELDGQLLLIGPGWSDNQEAQTLVTRVARNAAEWELVSTFDLPADTWLSRVVGNGDMVVAIGEHYGDDAGGRYEAGEMKHSVYTTTDGIVWSVSDLVLDPGPDENVYIQDIVMGAAGIAMSVQFESYPEEQPLHLVFETYEVTIDHARGVFSLTDIDSGEVVLSGTTEEIFSSNSDGQNIYNPDTNELIVTIPYEIWERAYNDFYGGGSGYGGSPLPIPINYGEPNEPPIITIEYDGFVVTVDEYRGTFSVADTDTDAAIADGPIDYLYQGAPPTFTDEDGEVLLAVTWDEWYQAEEQSYMNMEYSYEQYNYSSRTALVTSTDGANWTTQTVADGSGGSSSQYLAATDNGFVAMVNTYNGGGERGTVWTMAEGVWTSADAERSELWLHNVATTDVGLLGVGDGAGGPALWSSPDGISWTSEFAILPQSDGSYAWMSDVAGDGSGNIGVLTIREKYSDYAPLVIEQDKYTAIFEDGESAMRVDETASGETVLALGWEDFEGGSANELVTYEDGATSIDLGNGDVMVITDDEAYAASEVRFADTGQFGLSVFLNDGTGWAEAVVEVEGGMNGASQLFLVDDKVIIGGNYWGMEDSYYHEGPIDGSFVVIVGTPIGG